MKHILRELKKTGAKIIFATTTPVCDEKSNLAGPTPPAHKNDDIIRYNKAVLEVFKDKDIIINDLFPIIYKEKEKYLSDDMIHPNELGVKLLGETVASKIKECGYFKNNMVDKNNITSKTHNEKTIQ